MQAIILAAGMGKRLKELTKNNTKCMVKINGITLIERMLHQIEEQHLSRIVIVVGYEGQKLIDYIATLDIKTPIIYINNPVYDKTNNIYSLALARGYLCEEDTLLFESDLILENSIVKMLLDDPRDTLALVDKYQPWMDGTCVKLNEDDSIGEFIPGKQLKFGEAEEYYKTVNVYKFGRSFSKTLYVPFLEAYQTALGKNEYYEQVLRVITMLDDPVIKAKRLDGQMWYEIDDIQDLDIAASMFAPDDERINLLQGRYGGYWRYPKLIDFCYLVNPYFPPQKMMDEIKASFEGLLTQYPSGMKVNSLLVAKNFSVNEENVLPGNGTAELINSLMEKLDGRIGFVRPTFEEYPNRRLGEDSISFVPDNVDFSYTVDDLMDFFKDKNVKNLLVVNPDNPSGNYIRKEELLKLVSWTRQEGIRLVIDESFVDFADQADSTLIDQTILENNGHLFVMKSISKSYGVPGLRLGILASGNKEIIADLKKDVSIWNINSFAEFYMQIEEKYKKDYEVALSKIRAERARYQKELSKIPGLQVIPSQANYVMVRLTGGVTAGKLTKELLLKHNLFIKDLSGKIKMGEYIRSAIRKTEDNNRLIEAIKQEMKKLMDRESGK